MPPYNVLLWFSLVFAIMHTFQAWIGGRINWLGACAVCLILALLFGAK